MRLQPSKLGNTAALMVFLLAAPAWADPGKQAPSAERPGCEQAATILSEHGPLQADGAAALDRMCEREALLADPQVAAAVEQWNRDYSAALMRHARTLAASQDPQELVAAALVLPGAAAMEPPPGPDRSSEEAGAAFAAALRLGRGDRLVTWLEALGCPGPASTPGCDPQAALQRLQGSEPDNAAVWLLAHSRAQDEVAADQLLERAAKATHYRWPFGELGALLSEQYAAVKAPDMSPQVAAASFGAGDGGALDLPGVLAMTLASAVALPTFVPLQRACFPPADAPTTTQRRAACLVVYTRMSQAPLLVTRSVALTNLVRMSAGSSEGPLWRERLRQLYWVRTHALTVLASATPAGYLQGVWRDGEFVAMERLLAGQGIAPVAPPGWLPASRDLQALITTGHEPARK